MFARVLVNAYSLSYTNKRKSMIAIVTKRLMNVLFETLKKKSCAHVPSVLRNFKRVAQQQIDFAGLLPEH
jgi:hypothetical protein